MAAERWLRHFVHTDEESLPTLNRFSGREADWPHFCMVFRSYMTLGLGDSFERVEEREETPRRMADLSFDEQEQSSTLYQ